MNTDLTFFTNEPNATLLDRFKQILKDVRYFDILVGYFRTSGFYQLYESFDDIEKIRILVGLNIDKKTYEIIEYNRSEGILDFESHKNTKDIFRKTLIYEFENSEDNHKVESGIKKFIEFLQTDCLNKDEDIKKGGNGKKLEIKAYPSKNIHAKVYISRFKEDDRDYGNVITGSSNFTEAGLIANREFNVQLKNKVDVVFALEQFEALWKDSVDISEDFIETVNTKTWLNDQITPYELYLKLIYEYLEEDINMDENIDVYFPEGFMNLRYQRQAVVAAKKILDAYNGVFLADVVGLGKTFISALLAQQLPGKILVICPPVLVEYWKDSFFEFGVRGAVVESLGKLENIIKKGVKRFDYIFIDEAHRFRNETTQGYAKLHQICWGKKVILVSATPLNNTINDIFSQIKLFQAPKKSTLPGVPNLEKFFNNLKRKLKDLKKSDPEYSTVLKHVSQQIRDKILKYIMIRRTRSDVIKYFEDDMLKQELVFPEVANPKRIVYNFSDIIEEVFNKTIALLKKFKYARYIPLLYVKEEIVVITEFEKQTHRNIGGFMKSLIVKRLESSFFAFKQSISRFITSYENFIKMFDGGTVYISKKVNVYDLLENDNEEKLLKLVEQDKAQKYDSKIFRDIFYQDLKHDLNILKEIKELWKNITDDPKIDKFIFELKNNQTLKDNRVIVFTESKETGDYLFENINNEFTDKVIFYSSEGGRHKNVKIGHSSARDIIKENFDPNSNIQQNDLKILITTDILAEGINLDRSNIVINYDLPWNPTRVLQRSGRVNRLGTKFPFVYNFNFFPTTQSDEHLGLEVNITSKIQAFHDTLGEDARYLTDEEVFGSKELFGEYLYKKLNDKKSYTGEDDEQESELKYLEMLRNIRDNNPDLFDKIKRLPKKARSGLQIDNISSNKLITFFRLGKLKKFFIANNSDTNEINFFDAVYLLKCKPDTKRIKIPYDYYELLNMNKNAFELATSGVEEEQKGRKGGGSNVNYIIKRLKTPEIKQFKGFTESDDEFMKNVLYMFEQGQIPPNTAKIIKRKIEKMQEPIKVLSILRNNLNYDIENFKITEQGIITGKKEVILSGYLIP